MESLHGSLTAHWDLEPAGVESCARMSNVQCAMSNVPLSEEISHFRQDFQASHGWNTDGTRISKRDLPGEAIFSVHSTFSKAIRALSLSVFNPCSIRGPRSAPSSPAQPLRPFVSRSTSLVAALPLWDNRGRLRRSVFRK